MFYGWCFLLTVLFYFISQENVSTNVTVEFLLRFYNNTKHQRFTNKGLTNCDTADKSGTCDVQFGICFKLGNISDNCEDKITTKEYDSITTINFEDRNVKDKDKLFVRNFTEPYGGIVSVFVLAWDVDDTKNESIDEYNSVLNIAASPNITLANPYNVDQSGIFKSGSKLLYIVKVYCSLNYYGNDCTRYCNEGSEICNTANGTTSVTPTNAFSQTTYGPSTRPANGTTSVTPTNASSQTTYGPSTRPDFCIEDIFGDDSFKGRYRFNETLVNVTIIISCKYNEVANLTRKCTSIMGTGPYWMDPDFEACDTATTKELSDLNKIPLCNDVSGNSSCSPDQIIQRANEIVNSSSLITNQHDVLLVSTIMNEVVLNSASAQKISSEILNLVDKVLEVNTSILSEAQTNSNSSRKILSTLDLLAVLMTLDRNTTEFNISKSNIGLNVGVVNNTNTYITTFQNHRKQMKIIISNKESNLSGMLASVLIPGSAFSNTNNAIYSIVYSNPNLFTTNNNIVIKDSEENLTKTGIAISVILSASVANQTIRNLASPVLIKFKISNLKNLTGKYDCYFWNFSLDCWSNDGCRKVSENNSEVNCECDHLTNFALIMDISQDEKKTTEMIGNQTFEMISWIGCVISLVGLFLTALNLVLFKKLRQKLPMKILFCLSTSLLVMLIIFLSGVKRGSSSDATCGLSAGLLHYFVLSSFCWTAVEAVNLYYYFVTIFKKPNPDKFMLFSSIFAWGFPLIIVIITACLKGYSDLGDKLCVIRFNYFYIGLLAPVAVILLMNFSIFVMVMKGINKRNFSINEDKKNILYTSRVAFICSVLLGLSWVFGVFALEKLTKHFQILFIISNSLQGFFIFVFYIVRNPDIQSEWRLLIKKLSNSKKLALEMGAKNKGYKSDLLNNLSENINDSTDQSIVSK